MSVKNSYREQRNAGVFGGIGVAVLNRMGTSFALYVGSEVAALIISWILWLATLALTLWGTYSWTKYKGRHEGLTFLGLIAPLGFIPLALMKDKFVEGAQPPTAKDKSP